MKKNLLLFIFIVFTRLIYANEAINPVDVKGDEINYSHTDGKIHAKGNVELKYKEVILFCDEADYDTKSYKANLKGNVKIKRKDGVVAGDHILYDFTTETATMVDVDIDFPPIYGSGETIDRASDGGYSLNRGMVTSCDLDDPHYRLVAKQITFYPGEKIVAKNMILKVGKIPIFYFPYFSQSLKNKSFPVQITPGRSHDWGVYALGRWTYNLNPEQKGFVHTDFYEKRGVGLGLTHKAETKKYGDAVFNYYSIQDQLYDRDKREEFFDEYPERINISDKYLEDDRYKAQLYYSWKPQPNLSIKAEFNKFSDIYFMKDYFYREYEKIANPTSYLLMDYTMPGGSLSLLTQKRVNRFYSETEYLPQLEYNYYRRNIGTSKFYFESKDKIGNITNTFADSSAPDQTAWRANSYNVLSYSDKIKWLTINPYIGSDLTYYSRNRDGDESLLRFVPTMGMTFSTKLYKYFNDLNWNLFGEEILDLRHVLTPEIQYSYAHDPSIDNKDLYQFDSVDNRSRSELITATLRNKLQAKNKERVWDFVYFSPAVNYRINEEAKGSYFESVTADLEIYPREGVSLKAKSFYNPHTRRITEFTSDVTISGTSKFFRDGVEEELQSYQVSVGHRYLRQESSQGTFNLEYQLTPRVRLKNYLRYEWNTGDFQRQQYAVETDLHCWLMDLGFDIDQASRGGKNFTFWVIFRLKAFPDLQVGFDQSYSGAKSEY
ncbi:MAG: hypothetical protein PHV17_00835 [Candidatus Omnitrophica bacterium]|nr:hypothetical protein [Candidatus Omnitrophota bacterium]